MLRETNGVEHSYVVDGIWHRPGTQKQKWITDYTCGFSVYNSGGERREHAGVKPTPLRCLISDLHRYIYDEQPGQVIKCNRDHNTLLYLLWNPRYPLNGGIPRHVPCKYIAAVKDQDSSVSNL